MISTIILAVILLVLTLAFIAMRREVKKGKPEEPETYQLNRYGEKTSVVIPGSPGTPDTYPLRKWLWVPVVVAALAVLAFCFVAVPANTWSVRTSLGKPTGEVFGSGPHLTLPWETGTEFSSSRQFVRFKDKPGDGEINRIRVRLAGQAYADLTGVISYAQPSNRVKQLFMDWRSEERVRELYALTLAQQSMSEALGTYDPLSADKQKADANAFFSAEATKKLNEKLGGVMENITIVITDIDYDDETEKQLSAIQAAIATTRIAEQGKLTANAIASANQTIAGSLSGDPVVAFYQCSAMWSAVVKALPATVTSLNIAGICSSTVGAVR